MCCFFFNCCVRNKREHRDIFMARIKLEFKYAGFPERIIIKAMTLTEHEAKKKKWTTALAKMNLEKDKLYKLSECDNIVNCFDSRTIEKDGLVRFELALEYLPKDLYKQMNKNCNKGQAFSLKKLARILRDILYGLKCVHDANIIHCDVKPGNLLYKGKKHGNKMIVKIADFGAARTTIDKNGKKRKLTGKHIKEYTEAYVGMYMNLKCVWFYVR